MSLSSAHASDLWELVKTPGVCGTGQYRSVHGAMPCNTDIDIDQQPVRAWENLAAETDNLTSPPTELIGWGGETWGVKEEGQRWK